MTHTFDSRGFFIFLVDLAQGVTLYESHGIYIHGKLLHTYICTLVFPHLSLRRLETNLIWVRVKWHYELYHRNHSTVQWSIFFNLIIGIQARLWACGRGSTPNFGSHLNPISTKGGRLCPPNGFSLPKEIL